MRALLRTAIIGTTCGVTLACSVSGFAQSHSVRLRDVPNTMGVVDGAVTALGVVQVYEARDPAPGIAVPANVTVSPHLLPLVESMLRASPTFRRQSLRIASASHLTVLIRHVHDPLPGPRARTRVSFDATGRHHAVVEVIAARDHAELIAHELEHVIEQLDGVDLATRVNQPAAGVRRCADGAFETLRAIRAGRAVAEEIRRSR